MRTCSLIMMMCCCFLSVASAEPAARIELLAPQTDGGVPLMKALKERRSVRTYTDKPLPPQVLSNLLWATFGINRSDEGKRTAPSALNQQEVDVYAVLPEGVYFYEPKAHVLERVVEGDLRAMTGMQPFAADAWLNLVFVVDHRRMERVADDEMKAQLSAMDVGYIAQNTYLFCASEGLATVSRGALDGGALHKAMKLRPEQKVILAQTVGYEK